MSGGIQVNPSSVSDFAVKAFTEDYGRLTLQAAELRAFAEAATLEIEKLEAQADKDQQTIRTLEGFINDQRETLQATELEAGRLRQEVEELREQARTKFTAIWDESAPGSAEPEHQDAVDNPD